MKEEWKDVIGYEDRYQISNLGRLKSKVYNRKCNKGYYLNKQKILTPSINKHGYKFFKLMKDKKSKTYKIHQLVAIAFLNHSPCGHDIYVDHIDRNKLNNNVNNLRLITPRESLINRGVETTSKYVGVSWDSQREKWVARIKIDGKYKFLGRFDNEELANNKIKQYI